MSATKGNLVGKDRKSTALEGDVANLRVAELQNAIHKAKLVQYLKDRRMNGVTPEVAIKVLVFFQQGGVDTGAGKHIGEQDAGRTAADYAAARDARINWWCLGLHYCLLRAMEDRGCPG
jgi:hypothetical protein